MTIYALSSGAGIAGVAVIRISGPDAEKILKKLIKGDFPDPRKATFKKIYNIKYNTLIDEGIIIWFPGPESYTGEDMAEIHVHGSIAVINALHDCLSKIENCRLAEPGEFSKIAFTNGKINLLKAESISDLISSETEIQRQQAINLMNGVHSKKYNQWRADLLNVLSKVEAKIDFPDEDLPEQILSGIRKKVEVVQSEINKTLDDNRVGERIREGFKIAILGPANAGKSSLLNYLSKREVAIVSEVAGTTRDVIETHLNLNGYPVVLSDTAGIRESKDEIEKKGVKLSLKTAENADLKIVVIEPKSAYFTGVLKGLIKAENTILVINKSDLGVDNIIDNFKTYNPIYISIKNEQNLNKLILEIKNRLKNKFFVKEHTLITRERHRRNLEDCINYLHNFKLKDSDEDFDKAAEDLRLAIRSLGKIVGKVDVEEVLGSIFNDFCIGK
jgi:tRNA modification GTPase